jgi:PPOX class probable F420-dependent enzyme
MSNPHSGIPTIDPNDPRGAGVIERLQNERIGWLTTVAADGTPKTSPIWFLWSEPSILIYSLESERPRNIADRPRISLNLDGDGLGGDIVVIEGTAFIDDATPSCVDNPDYLEKYESVIDDHGWTPEWFAERYRVPIVITPTKYRYW